MVNNIAANVLGGKPELTGGTETADNTTAEEHEKGSTDVAPVETPHNSAILETAEHERPAAQVDSSVSSDLPPSSPDSHEERQIVTLVEEEEEDEEPRQSTVTLMEEEGEEEEEKPEETTREAGDRSQWESQTYCPFSSLSSLSLSCMATLPELLHRWCSARLARERLRSLRRKQLRIQSETRPDPNTSILTHTSQLIPAPVPTSVKESLPLTEQDPELDMPVRGQNEGTIVDEVHVTHPNTHTPDAHTPELNILLEPSRTTIIPPHSFSEVHSSLRLPTPTHGEKLLPPMKDIALDPVPTPPLQAISIPETQQASSATLILTVSVPPQPAASETGSPDVGVPPGIEQPVQPLPTASRPADLIPPPTELPTALPPTDTDTVKSGADGGDLQRHSVQTSQTQGEQRDSLSQTGEPRRTEDTVDDDMLNTNGSGIGHRTVTDFYAELQNGGDYNSGTVNGNGALLNGGVVHGSNQKESVFMRLNNRIKALEMNMSLSSRYLEELSQRYRKQMEEMQRAFNKTVIKLQNTSRIAEEQDQKQTESIQVLQSQLENVTKLMINLTATVGQLQREVSDRQSYLVVSLVLCLSLVVLLCLQCCCSSSPSPNSNTAALPMSNHYPSPKRCFSAYDDMSLKRRVTCPLVRSKSFHFSSTEVGPDDLYIVEPLRFSPEKKKKRCRTKSLDKVEMLKAIEPSAPISNGGPKCNGFQPSPPATIPPPPPPLPPPPPPLPPPTEEFSALPTCTSKDCPSETSSSSSSTHSEESYTSHLSSHSEESYTSRLPPPSPILPSTGLYNGHDLLFPLHQPPAVSRQERRSMKRRKSRQTELHFPALPREGIGSLPSLQHLMKGNKEISVGTIGVTAVTGHV